MAKTRKIWKCPKCNRIFKVERQRHSCTNYPIEKHLKGKPYAEGLFLVLKNTIRKRIGPFIVESLPCCIHLLTKDAYTFAAVYALKDRIRLHIASGKKLNCPRFGKPTKMSASRFLCSIDVKDKSEIDAELVQALKEAYSYQD
jgi:hypothetical protein